MPIGEIPKSEALAEAGSGVESISELLSRDPETLTEEEWDRELALVRAQRERWEEAEKLQLPKRKSAQKEPLITKTDESVEDLGL